MNGMVIKFKGARPYSEQFPDSKHMYSVAPLSFRQLIGYDNISPTLSRHEFFGSHLEKLYRTVASSTPFETYERKWGKERVFCFGDSKDARENIYQTLRLEERIFSEALVDTARSIAQNIHHPDKFNVITQGSHSPHFGMGAGGYMSWLDGDVNITVFLDVPPQRLYDECKHLILGVYPESAGGRVFYPCHFPVKVSYQMPITQDVLTWTTGFGISFAAVEDFYLNRGKLNMWKFLIENGYPIDDEHQQNHQSMVHYGLTFENHRAFSNQNLNSNEYDFALSLLKQGALYQMNNNTPEFCVDSSLQYFNWVMDAVIPILSEHIDDFSWSTQVCPLPNIEFLIKNKAFRIVANRYS